MNIISLIAGNASSLFAMGSDAISSSRKSINSMLWIQNISQLFYAIGRFCSRGIAERCKMWFVSPGTCCL